MLLPTPGSRWDPRAEASVRDLLMQADAQNLKRGRPAETGPLMVAGTLTVSGAASIEGLLTAGAGIDVTGAVTAGSFVLSGAADMTAVSYSGAGGQKHVLIGQGSANQNVVLFVGGVEAWRVDVGGNWMCGSDGGGDIGGAADKRPNNVYVVTRVTAGAFKTDSASVSCLNNTATTVYALPNERALWLVRVNVANGGAALYGASALVMVADGSARVAVNGDAASAFITVSGLNLQVRQTSGATNTVGVTLVKISG